MAPVQVDTVDDVSTFAYDWRRDNNESADRFIAYLEQIKRRHGGRAAQVVAHSNGGKRIGLDNQDWLDTSGTCLFAL